ncbi:hypothetical protein GW17_00038988, partial [Ensete ventricosum]
EDRRQSAMARPSARVASHGLATCKGATSYGQGPLQRGDRLWPRPPARGGWILPGPAHRGYRPRAQPLTALRQQG